MNGVTRCLLDHISEISQDKAGITLRYYFFNVKEISFRSTLSKSHHVRFNRIRGFVGSSHKI